MMSRLWTPMSMRIFSKKHLRSQAKPNTPTADTTQEINFVFDEDEDDTPRQETDKPKEEKKSVGLPGWLRGRRK